MSLLRLDSFTDAEGTLECKMKQWTREISVNTIASFAAVFCVGPILPSPLSVGRKNGTDTKKAAKEAINTSVDRQMLTNVN